MDVTSYLLGKKAGGGETPTLINKNITANGTYNASSDEADGYKKVVVDVPPTTYPDWTAIGYEQTPQSIINGYNYAVEIKNNWNASQPKNFENDKKLMLMPLVDTSNMVYMNSMFKGCDGLLEIALLDTSNVLNMNSMFNNCTNLIKIPLLNTENTTNFNYMFNNCYKLSDIPLLNTENITNITGMFYNCNSLSDTSLDNILQMCIEATKITNNKTLSNLGLTSTNYPATKIQSLTHYQDFIDAGWTIGY